MQKNDKKPLPPSDRDHTIRTRIMLKRAPERRSTKSFAQDRGSTGFLRMVLRAHNASAHVPERGRKRSLRKRIFDKKPSEGVFAVKTSEQHKLEKSVLLARSESQKVDGGLRGGEPDGATRARKVADEL